MKTFFLSVFFLAFAAILKSNAQEIIYADVVKQDVERMNFEIIGKAADNYVIYKEAKGKPRISVYDYNMKLMAENPISVLPKNDDILDISFYTNAHHNFLLFQYQEGDVVYLKGAHIEANGQILDEPKILDTTMIAYKTQNKIYNIINSNDQSKLMVFKINKKDKSLYKFTTLTFNESLEPISESRFSQAVKPQQDFLTGYSIANDGSFAFLKYSRQQNGIITAASLIEKPFSKFVIEEHELNTKEVFLDDLKLMIDEKNSRYLISSFYTLQKRGDIEGLYGYAYDKSSGKVVFEKTNAFDDDLKKRAKGKSSIKNAFDDYYINNIVAHNDGGFTVSAEVLFNSGNQDRWGFWGSSFWGSRLGYWGGWGPGWGWGWSRWGGFWSPYSYYSPFFYRSYWWGGYGPGWYGNSYQQFNAGNIAIITFDKEGNKVWDNVIVKSQREDNTDGSLSYQIFLTENNMHYLLNNSGKISELENIVIQNNGSLTKSNPVLAKEKRLDFMPRYGKQTGDNEMIIPYLYRSNISFAKLKF